MANAAGFSRAIGPNAQYDLALSTIDIPCTTAFNTHILPMRCPRRKVGLSKQFSLSADRLSGPEGLRYADEFVSPAAEKTLIGHIAILPLQPFQVWPIRRQTPRGLVRISIRLHHAPARGGRSDPRVAGLDHREGRSFRRPRHPNWPSPLHRVRRRCRHRLAPGQAALRPGVRPVAGLRLQVPVSKDRLLQVGTFHARGSATFDLHDVGSVAGGLGTQHPCRRGAALLDHLPDDGREILMARPNLCYLLA